MGRRTVSTRVLAYSLRSIDHGRVLMLVVPNSCVPPPLAPHLRTIPCSLGF